MTLVGTVAIANDAEAQFADGFGAAVAIVDGRIAVMKPNTGIGAAGVYVYGWAGGAWTQEATLHPAALEQTGEGFSPALVSVGGELYAASADAFGLWAADVFRPGPSAWASARVAAVPDAAERDAPPMSLAALNAVASPPTRTMAVSSDGRFMALGGPAFSGSVLVLERSGDAWRRVAQFDSEEDGNGFGTALAFDAAGHLFVGAPTAMGRGAVYIYAQDGADWEFLTAVSPSQAEGQRYGAALVSVGDASIGVAVGAPGANFVAFVNASTERGTRTVSGDGAFGTSLSWDGRELWVGAPSANEGLGSVTRLALEGRTFRRVGTLEPAGLAPGAGFGAALAHDGDVAVVGAPLAHAGRGSAMAFRRSGGEWSASEALGALDGLGAVAGAEVRCEAGSAAGFDCRSVDLLAFVPLQGLGAAADESVTDIWGWTDPETEREYALIGRSTGAVIVDVTDPSNPVTMGRVSGNRTHARDIKVFRDHMFFTGDGAGEHGLLVFDLTKLRDVTSVPVEWEPDAKYEGIASAHNLVINEETGFGYTVGNRAGGTTCGGGLHMVDLNDPLNPSFAGCYTDTEGLIWQGRTHDAQCVIYRGPDEEYRGREICFALNETAVRIVDVTDKSNPLPIAAGRYPGMAYVHQGWLTDDHRYFYQNDEADELAGMTSRTRTLIWNVEDLDDPVVVGEHFGTDNATDHNLYVIGNRMYQANYHAGMRVFDITDRENPTEIGFFDTTPYGANPPGFNGGAWTAYPFFPSGTVVVSSMNEGLFILRPRRPIS